MAQTAGGTYYAASSELVSSWPATSLDLANQLESRFAAKAPSASPTFTGTVDFSGATVTGLSAAGLTLITTASINAAASTLINTCFTSTYDFYTIIGDLTGSTDLNYLLQLRNAGSTVTAANYQLFGTGYDNGNAARNVSTNGATSWTIGRATAAGVPLHFTLTITGPLENRAPAFSGTSVFYDSTVTSTLQRSHGYRYGASQAFDSLAFSTSTGNVTGTIRVYGYRKS